MSMIITKRKALILFIAVTLMISMSFCYILSSNAAYADDLFDTGYDLKNDYAVKISYYFIVKYISGVEMAYDVVYDKDFYNTVENKKDLMKSTKDTFVKNGFELTVDETNGHMYAAKRFSTTTDYYIALGLDGYEVEEEKQQPSEKSFFYYTYEQTSETIFSNLKTEGKFINRIYNTCVDAGIDDDKILLNYVYGTPYSERTLKSTRDALTYSASEKLYYHTFEIPIDSLSKTYTIYRKVPNTKAWYLLAVVGGLAIAAIPLGIYIYKKQTEKKNGAKSNE